MVIILYYCIINILFVFSISLEDSSDEEFELSSGIDKDYESMLLSKIRKLELEVAELQRKVEQNKSEDLIETAKNLL